MQVNNEPKILGFLCNWCGYAGADMAGTSRMSYPSNIRIVRVPCSGRVDPLFIIKGFQQGADGILVVGCHPGDCHYKDGNYHARRRMSVLRPLLDFMGIEEARLRLEWVSASEGKKFATLVREFTEKIKSLGPAPGSTGVPPVGRTGVPPVGRTVVPPVSGTGVPPVPSPSTGEGVNAIPDLIRNPGPS